MIGLLIRLGLGPAVATRLAPFAWGIAVFALCALMGGLWLQFHDEGVIDRHEMKIEAMAAQARETAAAERVDDALANARQEEKYHGAIDTADDNKPGDAAIALNCERLRRIGRIPAACRLGGSDGSQAPAL